VYGGALSIVSSGLCTDHGFGVREQRSDRAEADAKKGFYLCDEISVCWG